MRRLLPGVLFLALLLPSHVALAQDGALHVYLDEDGKEIVSPAILDELELVEVILPEKRAVPSSPKKLPDLGLVLSRNNKVKNLRQKT